MPNISRTAGLLLVAALLAALLLVPMPAETLWQRTLADAGHGPVFAAIAVLFLAMQPATDGRHSGTAFIRAFGLAVALGIATEIAQVWLPNRSVSATDVLHDAAGAVLGLALVALIERRRSKMAGTVPMALPVALLLGSLIVLAWDPIFALRAYSERRAAFPTLISMGRAANAAFAAGRNGVMTREPLPAPWRRSGDGEAMRIAFSPKSKPALSIFEPAPDWRGYRRLNIDITNPGHAPLVLTLRIHDRTHNWEYADRFNRRLVIAPATRRTVQVSLADVAAAPAGRRMDMAAIVSVMLFAWEPVPMHEFYVSRVWLDQGARLSIVPNGFSGSGGRYWD